MRNRAPILLTGFAVAWLTLATGIATAQTSTAQTSMAPAIPLPAAGTSLADLPIVLDENLVRLEVELEGYGPLQAVLDTGASHTVLSRETATRLGLPLAAGTVSAFGATGPIEAVLLRAPIALRLGTARVEMAPVAAISLASLSQRCGWHIDAIVGAELFRRYVVETDYAGRRLRLYEAAKHRPRADASVLPITLHNGSPHVEATVTAHDGTTLTRPFLLDSGATATLILTADFAARHPLADPAATALTLSAHGASRAYDNTAVRIGALTLAGHTFTHPVVYIAPLERGPLANPTIAGLLGAKTLRRFTVTFDYRQRLVFFEPNAHYNEPDKLIGTGLRLRAEGTDFNRFTVREVLAGSPAAEHGVAVGDALLRVDGRPAAAYDLPTLLTILRREGQQVRIELSRNGKSFATVLTPRALI